jgi:hypothetical protein
MICVRLRVDDDFSGLGDGHARTIAAAMASSLCSRAPPLAPPVAPATNQLRFDIRERTTEMGTTERTARRRNERSEGGCGFEREFTVWIAAIKQ